MHHFFRKIALATAFATLALTALTAAAQYPSRPVRIILPMQAGSSSDTVTRIVAMQLAQFLGQPVMVENRPGADGAIGGEAVAKSAPDGYTLLMGTNSPLAAVSALRKNPPYDPITDFTPISFVGRFTHFLVVNADVPAKTLMELVAYARANPGKLNYASGNTGGILYGAQFTSLGQVDMVHVPYKGEPAAMIDLLSGRVQMMFATSTVALPHVKSGAVRALAVVLGSRSPLLPDVPTFAEAGMARFTGNTWMVLVGPAKMPEEVVERLNREVTTALQRPDVREQIERQGVASSGSTPGQLAAFMKDQIDVWTRMTREAGLKPE